MCLLQLANLTKWTKCAKFAHFVKLSRRLRVHTAQAAHGGREALSICHPDRFRQRQQVVTRRSRAPGEPGATIKTVPSFANIIYSTLSSRPRGQRMNSIISCVDRAADLDPGLRSLLNLSFALNIHMPSSHSRYELERPLYIYTVLQPALRHKNLQLVYVDVQVGAGFRTTADDGAATAVTGGPSSDWLLRTTLNK
ncbi:hypothetical protein EVAR_14111_1 [Eumeta japonica]|uniref:Uncharacterized protein n=1 Tax=Eumeta variegata TaxID=151549 RepID=A0A4C1UNY5_EUMVA|nr:hypothetical protein EVAR_14111_1 [Eumeta japonica]